MTSVRAAVGPSSEPTAAPDLTPPENRLFYPALDGLRALAVGLVFLVHTLPTIFGFGWIGVQIFFVLSGFLITGILFDTRDDPHRFRNFYVRRALRIFPLYYGFLLLCLAVLWLTHAPIPHLFTLWWVYGGNFFWLLSHKPVNDVLFTGTGTPFAALGHLWSLAVEEQFYLLWPLAVFSGLHRRRIMQLCLGLIVARLLLGLYWQMHLAPVILLNGFIYRMLPTQCDGFLLGGLLALWLRGRPTAAALDRLGRLGLPLAVLGLATLVVLHHHAGWIRGRDVYDYRNGLDAVLILPLINLVAGAVLLATLHSGTVLFALCDLRLLRSIGRVSYGIYVFHLPARILVERPLRHFYAVHGIGFHDRVVTALLTACLTLALSYTSFYLYERPFLRLKDRFTAHRITPPPLSPTFARAS